VSMDPKPIGGGSAGVQFGVGVGEAATSQSTETVTKIVAKVLDGVVTKSRVTADAAVTQALANSLAMSMGLAAAKLMSPADLALLLKTVQSKVEQSMITLSKNDIERIQKDQKDQAEVRLKNLQEQIEKANKAQKGGLIGQIFSWIAAAFMAIAGAILMATGVAAAAGAALLIGGVAMMTALALQIPGPDGVSGMDKMINGLANLLASTGVLSKEEAQGLATGIIATLFIAASAPAFIFAGPAAGIAVLGSLLPLLVSPDNLEKMGMSTEEAQKLSLGLSIAMAVVAIAVTAGPALASGISSAAGRLSQLTANMSGKVSDFMLRFASKAAEASEKATKLLEPMSKAAERLSTAMATRLQDAFKMTAESMQIAGRAGGYSAQLGQALAMIGSGVATGVGVQYGLELTKAKAEEKLLNAFMMNLAEKFQTEKERLEELIRKLMNFDPIVAMMESTFEAASFVERHN